MGELLIIAVFVGVSLLKFAAIGVVVYIAVRLAMRSRATGSR
jgi:hypothetical protein